MLHKWQTKTPILVSDLVSELVKWTESDYVDRGVWTRLSSKIDAAALPANLEMLKLRVSELQSTHVTFVVSIADVSMDYVSKYSEDRYLFLTPSLRPVYHRRIEDLVKVGAQKFIPRLCRRNKSDSGEQSEPIWPGSFLTVKYAFSTSLTLFSKFFNVLLCGYITKCLFQCEIFWPFWQI